MTCLESSKFFHQLLSNQSEFVAQDMVNSFTTNQDQPSSTLPNFGHLLLVNAVNCFQVTLGWSGWSRCCGCHSLSTWAEKTLNRYWEQHRYPTIDEGLYLAHICQDASLFDSKLDSVMIEKVYANHF